MALGRRPDLHLIQGMFNWRIGGLGLGRGFRSIYSIGRALEEFVPCKVEFEIDSYCVSFETSPPPDQGSGGGGGVVLTMQNMVESCKGSSFAKVFSSVSASPILPDVIPDSSPRINVDYLGSPFRRYNGFGDSFLRMETARIICAPIRPLFPAHFYHDVEVMAKFLCRDGFDELDTDVMAANATSAALMLSDIPWGGPIGVARIGRIGGKFVINPSRLPLSYSDFDLVYACSRDHKTLMADVQAREVTEKYLEKALQLAHQQAVKYLAPQIILAEKAGKHKKDYTFTMLKESTIQKIMSLVEVPLEANSENKKFEGVAEFELTKDVERILDVEEHNKEKINVIPKMVDMLKKKALRRCISEKDLRLDGRRPDKVRRLQFESTKMSELQGSSLFACGSTQVICTVTQRRPREDEFEYLSDDLLSRVPRYLYHNRPFRVDGNWKLADCGNHFVEKALIGLLPEEYGFPYVVRVNSQAIHSDGSISTATVCGGSIALMSSGAPLKKPVAGVSVGMISEVHPTNGLMNNYRMLTDLSSLEEHLVDMNFKVAGSRDGITAIQLDVNVAGVPLGIICECLGPALKGRLEILDQMEQEISAPMYCTSDDWGWRDAIAVTYTLPTKFVKLLTEPDGAWAAWQINFEQETGTRISMDKNYRELTVAAKNRISHILAKRKLETDTWNEVEAGRLRENEAAEMKCYVEVNGRNLSACNIIPIEQVDLNTVIRAVECDKGSYSHGCYNPKLKIFGLPEYDGDFSEFYESDSERSDSVSTL
ncbi:hypothetical protein MKW92_028347 [Papaver armeniacum]|nr:hypothetical protein MKW92_028347 [Papaver armeniacum]